jgi:hypothetical protein
MTCSRCGGERDRPGQRYCRACHADYCREWRRAGRGKSQVYDAKAQARKLAYYAFRRGRITQTPCEHCGIEERLEMHHDDYSKPLEVRWLCVPCHKALTARQRRETVVAV